MQRLYTNNLYQDLKCGSSSNTQPFSVPYLLWPEEEEEEEASMADGDLLMKRCLPSFHGEFKVVRPEMLALLRRTEREERGQATCWRHCTFTEEAEPEWTARSFWRMLNPIFYQDGQLTDPFTGRAGNTRGKVHQREAGMKEMLSSSFCCCQQLQ